MEGGAVAGARSAVACIAHSFTFFLYIVSLFSRFTLFTCLRLRINEPRVFSREFTHERSRLFGLNNLVCVESEVLPFGRPANSSPPIRHLRGRLSNKILPDCLTFWTLNDPDVESEACFQPEVSDHRQMVGCHRITDS